MTHKPQSLSLTKTCRLLLIVYYVWSHVPFFVLERFTDRSFLDNNPIPVTRLFISDDKPMRAADTRYTIAHTRVICAKSRRCLRENSKNKASRSVSQSAPRVHIS